MILMPPVPTIQQPPALTAKDFHARCGDLSKVKDWKGLEALAKAQLASDPKDAAAQSALGYALLAQNRSEEGKAACEAALSLDPNRTDALYYLGLEAARTGDTKTVMVVAKRIGARSAESEVRFLQIPAVQQTAIAPLEVPVAPGVHFKKQTMERLMEVRAQPGAPMVVALVVDPEGLPISSQALMAPNAQAAMCLEMDAMHWRVEPVLIAGKPSSAKFVAVIHQYNSHE